MRHELCTEITIDAPPDRVWQILTDLEGYGSWNPFIVTAAGRVAVGQRLTNRFQPPGGRGQTLEPTVTVVEPPERFEWLGHLGLPGIFDGRHRFELEPTDGGGTRLVHRELFSGLAVRWFRSSLDTTVRQGFELMNEALKARAESNVEIGR